MKKVIVGLSGGVDSAVTASLLKKEGYEVIGVTLVQCDSSEFAANDAAKVADELHISHRIADVRKDFQNLIETTFKNAYLSGRTPNPCVSCNRLVKFKTLLRLADEMGADFIATGHYAKIISENGAYFVSKAKDAAKDQSYMLYQLSQKELSRAIFPLGNFTKSEVRNMAKTFGISVASKKDSEDICFIPSGDYISYITDNQKKLPPIGNFVNESGNILGQHEGIYRYTVGQRKGLKIALGKPAYVKSINAEKNEVVLADDEDLYEEKIFAGELYFPHIPPTDGEEFSAVVKIRYHHKGTPTKIIKRNDTLEISFALPVRAPARGQAAVLYDDKGKVLGGGYIL